MLRGLLVSDERGVELLGVCVCRYKQVSKRVAHVCAVAGMLVVWLQCMCGFFCAFI